MDLNIANLIIGLTALIAGIILYFTSGSSPIAEALIVVGAGAFIGNIILFTIMSKVTQGKNKR